MCEKYRGMTYRDVAAKSWGIDFVGKLLILSSLAGFLSEFH